MFDAVALSNIPADATAVAGYVDGRWPTWSALRRRWPDSYLLSIATDAAHDADALDVEAGDAGALAAPGWVIKQHARGVARPVLYASLAGWPFLLAELQREGVPRDGFRIWSAHYTGAAHRCSPRCGLGFNDHAGATQWTDRALGRELDESLVMGPEWFPRGRQ
jgi:hypothetical protein